MRDRVSIGYLWIVEKLYLGVRGSKDTFWVPLTRGYHSRQEARAAKKRLAGRTRVKPYSSEDDR